MLRERDCVYTLYASGGHGAFALARFVPLEDGKLAKEWTVFFEGRKLSIQGLREGECDTVWKVVTGRMEVDGDGCGDGDGCALLTD